MNYKELNKIQKDRMKQITAHSYTMEWENPEFMDRLLGVLPEVRRFQKDEQFEKLCPTVEELNGIYSAYGADAVNESIKRLVEDKYVIYLKRSNNYLRLKETSGVDVRAQISDMVSKRAAKLDI